MPSGDDAMQRLYLTNRAREREDEKKRQELRIRILIPLWLLYTNSQTRNVNLSMFVILLVTKADLSLDRPSPPFVRPRLSPAADRLQTANRNRKVSGTPNKALSRG